MFKFLYFLLSFGISHFNVNSVPIRLEKQQLLKIQKRGVGVEAESIKYSGVKESKLADELSNAFLSLYLKDLFVNSSHLARSSHALRDHRVPTAQTIRSYRNQAKSKWSNYIFYY